MNKIRRILGVLAIALTATACASGNASASNGSSVPRETTVASSNFDGLQPSALIALFKSGNSDTQSLEQALNTEGGINNLDLNNDGQMDWIKVIEMEPSSENIREISINALVGQDENGKDILQEVAQITVERESEQSDRANVVVVGNPSLYGPYARYEWRDLYFRDYGYVNYLFGVHAVYRSPWYWGYYPSYWHSYSIRPSWEYRGWVRNYTRDQCPRYRHHTQRMTNHSREWRNASSGNVQTSQRRNNVSQERGSSVNESRKPSSSLSSRQSVQREGARSERTDSRLRKKPASRGEAFRDRRSAQSSRVERKPDSSRGSRGSRNDSYLHRPNAGSSPSVRPASPRTNRGTPSARPPSSRPNAQRAKLAPRSAPSAPRQPASRSKSRS